MNFMENDNEKYSCDLCRNKFKKECLHLMELSTDHSGRMLVQVCDKCREELKAMENKMKKCDGCEKEIPLSNGKEVEAMDEPEGEVRKLFLCENCYEVVMGMVKNKIMDDMANALGDLVKMYDEYEEGDEKDAWEAFYKGHDEEWEEARKQLQYYENSKTVLRHL